MNVRRSSVAHLHQDGLDTLKALKVLHRHRTHQDLAYTLKDYVEKLFKFHSLVLAIFLVGGYLCRLHCASTSHSFCGLSSQWI